MVQLRANPCIEDCKTHLVVKHKIGNLDQGCGTAAAAAHAPALVALRPMEEAAPAPAIPAPAPPAAVPDAPGSKETAGSQPPSSRSSTAQASGHRKPPQARAGRLASPPRRQCALRNHPKPAGRFMSSGVIAHCRWTLTGFRPLERILDPQLERLRLQRLGGTLE